jgi:hypothetical protein
LLSTDAALIDCNAGVAALWFVCTHSITGRVFDVSAGKEHYGAGTGYSGFTGTLLLHVHL